MNNFKSNVRLQKEHKYLIHNLTNINLVLKINYNIMNFQLFLSGEQYTY